MTATPKDMSFHPASTSEKSKTDSNQNPIMVKIGGKMTAVNEIIRGPLCDDNWNGTIYVACDVQVSEWEEQPVFFKDCNLDITPGSVVYVAAHNDTAYYNGCSCHTGEDNQ